MKFQLNPQEGTRMIPETPDLPNPHSCCSAVLDILSRIGDKWTVLAIIQLQAGPLRFNELKRSVGGISQRMLTLTLRHLERDGLVTRTVYPTIPPRVEYQLTTLGQSLLNPLMALGEWVEQHQADVRRAREIFDTRTEELTV
ncbi:winged helix-turn-helix transcriptional regulator [Klebsiella variicola]